MTTDFRALADEVERTPAFPRVAIASALREADALREAAHKAYGLLGSAEQVRDHHDDTAYQLDGDTWVAVGALLKGATDARG